MGLGPDTGNPAQALSPVGTDAAQVRTPGPGLAPNRASVPLVPGLLLVLPGECSRCTSERGRAHSSQPLRVLAVSLPSLAPLGLPEAVPTKQHPHASIGREETLSFLTANWSLQDKNVGLPRKGGGQVLDASPSKLEIFLFSRGGIVPTCGYQLLCCKDVKNDQKNYCL